MMFLELDEDVARVVFTVLTDEDPVNKTDRVVLSSVV